MITIKKVEDTSVLRSLPGVELRSDVPRIYMAALDGEVPVAAGWLELKAGKTYLAGVACAEGMQMLAHSMGKSLLNLADLQHIPVVYGDNMALEKLYRMLGFKPADGVWSLELEGYFTAGHEC